MKPNPEQAITFEAIFSRATTTVDGGWNLTLSCNQSEVTKISQISAMRERVLQIAIIPIPSEFGELDA